jgi:diphthine-ammonia ligase
MNIDIEFFSSWSGGKDSCLALHRSVKEGLRPSVLLTMLAEGGQRSRSHGLSAEVLQAQAESMVARLVTKETSWDDYETNFLTEARKLREEGVTVGVFGDIDLIQHREWVEKVCSKAGVEPRLPLWNTERETLLDEFLSSGFEAIIVSVKDGVLGERWLGRTLDRNMIGLLKSSGVDPSGEAGEYHTCVIDGPLFSHPIKLRKGEHSLRDGYRFLDLSVTKE